MHNFVVLTADQVLHERRCCQSFCRIRHDSHQDNCQSYHKHQFFWMSGSRLILDDSFCGNFFIGCCELHNFSSRSVFMTTLPSLRISCYNSELFHYKRYFNNMKIPLCLQINKNQTTHLFSANFNKNQ